jgi:photosystem II stability/assembly factor-like uncharacterized protein
MTDEFDIAKGQNLVHALATSPAFERDGVCFAARPSGLYGSHDGGQSWQSAYGSLALTAPLTTSAVAFSPSFAADQTLFAGVPGAILRSGDGGRSWFVTPLPSPPPFVSSLVVSPGFVHDGIVLAGTMEDGVFRSGDRGVHWAAWNFGLLDLNVLCLAISPAFAEDETVFAGTDSGVFWSTNGGRAWREVDFSADLAPVLSLALSPSFSSLGVLFAGTESCGLHTSPDRGRSWTWLGEGVIAGAVNAILLSPEFPDRPEILVSLADALLVSRDGGQTWSDWNPEFDVRQTVTALAAPLGLGLNAPLLVGLEDGQVRVIRSWAR